MTLKRRGTAGGGGSELEGERAALVSGRPPARTRSRSSRPPVRAGFTRATLRAAAAELEIELVPAYDLARPLIGPEARPRGDGDERATIPPSAQVAATRTLGVGALVDELVAVVTLVSEPFVPALLVTVPPARLGSLADEVRGERRSGDLVVGRARLVEAYVRAMRGAPRGFVPSALVLRTAGEARARGAVDGRAPAWLTLDAVLFLRQREVEHLLTDLPSLDPPGHDEDGEGARRDVLRAFFGVPDGAARARAFARAAPRRTVTERVVVPDVLDDGAYVVSIELPATVADVVPSRPVLYRVLREGEA